MLQPTDSSLIQLHIAEYQALTTRGSYWIVLQVSLLPIIPIYLALAAQMWQSGVILREVVIWMTLAGLQIVGIVWAQTVLEQYALVRYVECYLRPMVEKTMSSADFWGYEPHLIKNRAVATAFAEPTVAILCSAFLMITCITRYRIRPWLNLSWWDICGVMANLGLLVLLWKRTLTAQRIRREWTRFDQKLAEKLERTRLSSHKPHKQHGGTTGSIKP